MFFKNKIYSIALIVGCFLGPQPGITQLTNNQIDSLVHHAMLRMGVVGASIGIVKDGRIIHLKGYGNRTFDRPSPVNQHTNFAIASNSKAFTSAALAILVEEGKLNWQDKVKDHIPEFKMYDPYVTEHFNIQDLLTHRSGLGLGVGDLMFFPDGSDFTIEDVLNCFQYFKPVSGFRTQFDYDNLLYLVAGEIIKRISGMTWEEFVSHRIFEPLGMDNSYAGLDEIKDKSNLASPHSTDSGNLSKLPDYKEMINGAAGGIYSNVDDLCQWMLVQLNHGVYGKGLSDTLFSYQSQREMWRIHTVLDASPGARYRTHFSGYGLGWMLADINGNMLVQHTGGLPGMLSITTLIPDLNLGIVVLTNTSENGGPFFQAVSRTITDSYLGLEDFNWVEKLAIRFEERQATGDKATREVWETVEKADASCIKHENFLGTYQDNWFGNVEIIKKDNQLWFRSLRSPKLHGAMYFYKANTFAIRWEYRDMNADAFAMFTLDEQGKAIGIKMRGISPNIDFSFDFHDLELKRID